MITVNSIPTSLVSSTASCLPHTRLTHLSTGLLNTTRAFLPLLRSRKTGTFVNISSIAGVQGYGASGLYCTSKFAVEGQSFCRVLLLVPPSR
jgi:NAD(P)-dependent dehydrogenase (short-subunit alcohol dehydrogenase family)